MSEPSARKEFPFKQLGTAIANLYARLQPKRSNATTTTRSATYEQDEAKTQMAPPIDVIVTLDDLSITNTITRRWPLAKLNYSAFVRTDDAATLPPLSQSPLLTVPRQGGQAARTQPDRNTTPSLAEDETEEMDALPGDTAES